MNVPQHVAIILDGNGRWAKAKGMPRNYGHAQGSKNVERICEEAWRMGIKYLTVYAFSTENWNRPKSEVDALMTLLRNYMKTCLKTAKKNDMKIRVIGDIAPLDDDIKAKIAQFCNVPKKRVIQNLDVDILYELPLAMEKEKLANVACECLNMECPQPDLTDWIDMVNAWKHPKHKVKVALVGKYVSLHDAYISVVEALKHGAVANNAEVEIKWVDSELVSDYNVDSFFSDVDGIIVPGGFGDRGIEGMICSIRYAREHKIPYLGLCLGMQLTIVEFARNVLGLKDAHSHEFNENTANPVIHIMPDKEGITDLGGTLRLGSYPCILDEHSKAYQLYGHKQIEERHRHRYEVNNDYREVLQENGMMLSGFSPDGRIVEMVEIPEHPWFIGTQAHPEFKSRPNKPHPLFKGFLAASLAHQK